MISNNQFQPKERTQSQIVAKAIGRLGRKYQHHIYAVGVTLIVGSQTIPAQAFGLFNPAQIALTCISKPQTFKSQRKNKGFSHR